MRLVVDGIVRQTIKRRLFVIMLFGMLTNAMAEKNVYIYARTGGYVSFSLSNSTKVTFDSGNIVVDMKDKQVFFPLSDYVTFKIEESSGITPITVNDKELFCRIEGNELILKNLGPQSTVCFYSLSGILLDSSRADADGTLFYNLESLTKQVIVIKTVNHSLKIVF